MELIISDKLITLDGNDQIYIKENNILKK